MEYEICRRSMEESPCYIFEGGVITADESGLISLINSE